MDGIRIANERKAVSASVALSMLHGLFNTGGKKENEEALDSFRPLLPTMKDVTYDSRDFAEKVDEVISYVEDYFEGKEVSKVFPDVEDPIDGGMTNFIKVLDGTVEQVLTLQKAKGEIVPSQF